jgi:Putative amidoligase enzyme.
MIDDEFFAKYAKSYKKPEGIPGFQMNAPLVSNNLPGMIGLELEIEGVALPREGHLEGIRGADTRAMWSAITDGSLRGESREYIFTQPCTRKELPAMVDALFKVFDGMGSQLLNSNRCSTHVHINMKGKTINQITAIIALWAVFEELLIKGFCGEERQTNHFALSMQDSDSLVRAWEGYLRFGNSEFPRGMKYSALNVLPLWDKGSLEFRCGPAADKADIPIMWAIFLDAFCEFAAERYRNPSHIAHDLSERGGLEIFDNIIEPLDLPEFRTKVVGDMVDSLKFNDTCLRGFRVVQPIVLGYPWEQWLELINREFVPNPFETKTKKKSATMPFRGARLEPAPGNWARPVEVNRINEDEAIPMLAQDVQAQINAERHRIAVEQDMLNRARARDVQDAADREALRRRGMN